MPPETKNTRKLTLRNYLGLGYSHVFENDITKEVVYIPCTQSEYESLGEVGGSIHNPSLVGHTWKGSEGGTIKVDTANERLGDDEYCIIGEKAVVSVAEDSISIKKTSSVSFADIADGNIDEDLLTKRP